jgi:ribosome maturation factor RimP
VVIGPAVATEALSVGACARVHRALAPVLDALVPGELSMEVSSPGVARTVKNGAELALYKGREIRVWDTRASDWRAGTVVAVSETAVTLVIAGTTEEIPFAVIAKAKLL